MWGKEKDRSFFPKQKSFYGGEYSLGGKETKDAPGKTTDLSSQNPLG
jgi:hypothetical protein